MHPYARLDSLEHPLGPVESRVQQAPLVGMGRPSRRPSTTEKLRIGLVGVGRWGRNYLGVLSSSPVASLAGICDSDSEAVRGPVLRGSVPRHASLGALLRDPGIEAVVLATPSETHGELGLQVLRAGKHLLIEKPMALRPREAEQMHRLAVEAGLVLAVGHLSLHQPALRELLSELRSGAIGEVVGLEAWRTSNGARTSCESALWSLAPHDIASAIEIFEATPRRVEARALSSRDGVPEAVELELAFAPSELGALRSARIHLSRLGPERRRELVVEGTRGRASLDEARGTLVIQRSCGARSTWSVSSAAPSPLELQVLDFVAAIGERRRPVSDGRAGLDVVRALVAAERTLATRDAGSGLPL